MGGPGRRCQAARKQHSELGEAQAAAGTVEILQPLCGTLHADESDARSLGKCVLVFHTSSAFEVYPFFLVL